MSNSRESIDISNWTHQLSIVNADDNAGGSITLEISTMEDHISWQYKRGPGTYTIIVACVSGEKNSYVCVREYVKSK